MLRIGKSIVRLFLSMMRMLNRHASQLTIRSAIRANRSRINSWSVTWQLSFSRVCVRDVLPPAG